MNVVMYTKRTCSACIRAKSLLDLKGISYNESVIGEDVLREDFVSMFPGVATVPFIIIDGVKVGGYEQLREFLDNRPEYLAG